MGARRCCPRQAQCQGRSVDEGHATPWVSRAPSLAPQQKRICASLFISLMYYKMVTALAHAADEIDVQLTSYALNPFGYHSTAARSIGLPTELALRVGGAPLEMRALPQPVSWLISQG